MSSAWTNEKFQPAALIESILRERLDAPSASITQGSMSFPEDMDWTSLCAVAHRCRIAPVIYQCLRGASLPLPPDVMTWFRVQYYDTVARNLALLNDLRELLDWLADAEIPAIVLKGPALAHFGVGLARIFHDLDILIRGGDLRRLDSILRRHGHREWPGPPHDFHRTYFRQTASGTRGLEVHFDISDRPRAYQPDIAGMWDRSFVTTVFDVPMRIPELSDQLLLAIMQLPHHHWSMRLVVDVWQVLMRWGEKIEWPVFLERAGAWRMRVLTKSTLHALGTTFGVPVAPEAMSMSQPSGYFERVQWRVATSAIAEQLEYPFRPRVTSVAPFLMVDQARGLPAMLMRRSLGVGGSPEESTVTKATRRTGATVAALPALGRLFLASIGQSSSRQGKKDLAGS
jgi:hypothetical protein